MGLRFLMMRAMVLVVLYAMGRMVFSGWGTLFQFTFPRQTVVDHCAGTGSTVEARMWLRRNRCSVWCETETILKESVYWLVQVYATQVLNEESDIVGTDDARDTANLLVSGIDDMRARWEKLLWDARQVFRATQSFLVHITFFLSIFFRYYSLYDMGKALSLLQQSKNGEGDSMRWMWILLSVDYVTVGLNFESFPIEYCQAGICVLAAKQLGKGIITGHYNGFHVYGDLCRL